MARALVAGGAGFIGSHLCERLLAEGFEVLCVDNLATGRQENVANIKGRPGFQLMKKDVARPLRLQGDIDYVLNLASPASPADFRTRGTEIMRVGALGTYNLLELAHSKGAVFLLASSSEIYGDPLVHPQHEDYWGNVNPVGPRSPYDESKRYAEALTALQSRTLGVEVRIARIFNTFGPRLRLDDGRLIPNFIAQLLRDQPLTIQGDGGQTRSFCYVDDMAEGLLRLMLSREGRPVNLGNPVEYAVSKLADLMEAMVGREPRRAFVPLPPDDPKRRRPDISRAKEVLGWEPKVGLEDGLARTLSWFRLPVQGKRA
jgi:dTDP-glucose 4,6-dehydratase